jgi:hypothetical protein
VAPRGAEAGGPPVTQIARPGLREAHLPGLALRQAAWVAASGGVAAMAVLLGLDLPPLLVLPIALAVGAAIAHPRRLHKGLLLVPLSVAAVALVAWVGGVHPALWWDGSLPPLSPATVLAAGGAAGMGAVFLDGRPVDRWRVLHGALGTAAGAGIGAWAASQLVPLSWAGPFGAALAMAITALVASQGLLAAAVEWRFADRLPTRNKICVALTEPYRAPVLRAWELDQGFEKAAPDQVTRDGLGEVAVWVYRMQYALQDLDREAAAIGGSDVEARVRTLRDEAVASDDDFTAERQSATADHLERLISVRDALALEGRRTRALVDYAIAYLEEARAGLTLARVQPGGPMPDRLGEVLHRLRDYGTEGDARRRTHREMGSLQQQSSA